MELHLLVRIVNNVFEERLEETNCSASLKDIHFKGPCYIINARLFFKKINGKSIEAIS